MRIVSISDTHSLWQGLEIPDADVFVCAGDFTNIGKLGDLYKFNKFLSTLPHKHKIYIAGNHDWYFYHHPSNGANVVSHGIYLQDRQIIIDGVKFYGTPWQPVFNNWAFNMPPEDRRKKFARIPDDTEVLITHAPPYGILDKNIDDDRVGDEVLLERVEQLKRLEAHIFGHIHGSAGVIERGCVKYVNACICNEDYHPVQKPIVIDIF